MLSEISSSGPCLFISDLHLDDSRPWVVEALSKFLDDQTHVSALFILGDLFEFWIGDDDDSALADRVARMLLRFSEQGPKVYIMHGNRDFLIGEHYASRCGAELLADPCKLSLGQNELLLSHGDALCTRDTEYQAFRKIARSPDWQAQMLEQDLPTRRQLAAQLRAASKDAGSRKADDIMDVTESEVVDLMHASNCAALIHGHTHRPMQHQHETGKRWVLGDWDSFGWYIEAHQDEPCLQQFEIPQS